MAQIPDWHRPKLTETQLGGEDNRLRARVLFPHQVRCDLIRALASYAAPTYTAACRKFGATIGVADSTIDNILNGRAPIYGPVLNGLYGPGDGNAALVQLANVYDFGPLTAHAVAAGLIAAPADAPKFDITEPVSGAAAATPPAASAPVIVGPPSLPPGCGTTANDQPAAAAPTAAPPAFLFKPPPAPPARDPLTMFAAPPPVNDYRRLDDAVNALEIWIEQAAADWKQAKAKADATHRELMALVDAKKALAAVANLNLPNAQVAA